MDIDVRKYIINNFKNDTQEDIQKAIDTSIESQDEDALIGLGVLFELAWTNCDQDTKFNILKNIKKAMK